MTLQQYKRENKTTLEAKWFSGANLEYANYESFCWAEWRKSGEDE